MADFLREELLYTVGVFVFMSCSILCQLLLGFSYGKLIQETENMATTTNRLLKQCKLKFTNCYQLHGVANIPVFVEKFMNKIQFGKLTMTGIKHLSGQFVMLSVFLCGWGACRGIISGKTLGQILPWYVLAIGGVYLYFAVSGLVDVQGKRQTLKINLVDYLENHLVASLSVLEEDKLWIEPGNRIAESAKQLSHTSSPEEKETKAGRKQEQKVIRQALIPEMGQEEAAELEAILREFLA